LLALGSTASERLQKGYALDKILLNAN